MAGVIYVLVGTKKSGEDEIFYCGRADSAATREKQHRRDCADPHNPKEAYEYARQAFNGVFRFEVIADEDARNTEDYWVTQLILDGHPLKNAVRGNSVVPRKRTTSPVAKAFREVNIKAEAEERRVSRTQQLTKSEILTQRIRQDIPSPDELDRLDWFEQPPEAMGSKSMRGAKRCEYTKLGDFNLYIGWKGTYKAAVRLTNTKTQMHILMDCDLLRGGGRIAVLAILVKYWADKHMWRPYEMV